MKVVRRDCPNIHVLSHCDDCGWGLVLFENGATVKGVFRRSKAHCEETGHHVVLETANAYHYIPLLGERQ